MSRKISMMLASVASISLLAAPVLAAAAETPQIPDLAALGSSALDQAEVKPSTHGAADLAVQQNPQYEPLVDPMNELDKGLAKLDPADLGGVAGGQTVLQAISTQTLEATSSNNTVQAGTLNTGAVSFAPGALSGFNGLGNLVVNTGANNVVQGAINLSISATPSF